MSQITQPRLYSAQFQADPFPFWRALRAHAPVFYAQLPAGRHAWLVTRYADAVPTLKDARLLKDPVAARGQGAKPPWMPAVLRPLARNMLDLDGADHARLRRLVQRAFTPRAVEGLRGRIGEVCSQLLIPAASAGRIDLVSAYALPLPVTIIAELLGVPPRDRSRFHAWSKRVVAVSSPSSMLLGLPAAVQFMRYVRKLIGLRRREPGDDLLTALLEVEDAGDTLNEDELVGLVTILLIAGHETTVNLIASGTLALLDHPAQLDRLRVEPGLMGSAVEELLRFTSPVSLATERYASEPMTIGGAPIARGDQVLVALSSANRDESEFSGADTLDLARTPNRHLAFGQGAHYCVGAPLARLEASIALSTLLDHAPGLKVAVPRERLKWRKGLFLRGLQALPVST